MNITIMNTTIITMIMNNSITQKIKLWGIVQGVGFRPFVAKVANRLGMKGEVLNIGGLVEITVTDTPDNITRFIDTIVDEKPGPSEIVHIRRTDLEYREFEGFSIIRSDEGDDEAAMIPADLAICPHCLQELYDPQNPRYRHPFISCMICGPRYTIIDKIPYDRENTSMIDFPMCDFCEGEYTDLHDRRHHAQTISCHDCGPQLIWRSRAGALQDAREEADSDPLQEAAAVLKDGGVIGFKSVGGYNLVADPFNKDAVGKLREIKSRESKPFAVMFRSIDEIRRYCNVDDVEAKLLESSARPIILLEHKLENEDFNAAGRDTTDLCRSRFIGSFLPSFAAQYLLLDEISPLIFTSANLSDMPMIKDDEEMAALFENQPLIDGIVYNTRRINLRADDSVARVIDDQPQMIRRSKGYAPVPLYLETGSSDSPSSEKKMILATGGQLKNSFALSKGPFTYVSQYFGDMDTLENQNIYEENTRRMSDLFRIRPELVVCDMHPLYYTSAFAEKTDLPVLRVQHHHAHVASVMAENNLEGPVIGVSFDGTGYGTDGCIWGSEFMLCRGGSMKRLAHLKYIDMIGGDSSMKDGVRSALSYIAAYDNYDSQPAGMSEDGSDEIKPDISDIIAFGRERLMKKPNTELILKAIETKTNTVRSSSMGRLFDAVSALLGICDYNSHEGQCAIMLEDAAAFAIKHPGQDSGRLGSARACELALSFHNRIIDMVVERCIAAREETGTNQVVLTGGTFQNRILMEGVLEKLRAEGFEPYYNISVSPNDGGIALGQMFIAMHETKGNG